MTTDDQNMLTGKIYIQLILKLRGSEMKDLKFKSNPKLDAMIQSILASSKFSSFQEYASWRISEDHAKVAKGQKLI